MRLSQNHKGYKNCDTELLGLPNRPDMRLVKYTIVAFLLTLSPIADWINTIARQVSDCNYATGSASKYQSATPHMNVAVCPHCLAPRQLDGSRYIHYALWFHQL